MPELQYLETTTCLLYFYFSLFLSPGGVKLNTRCILDDDGTSPEVDTCLRNADQFLDRYLRHIRENTLADFDRCR